MADNTQVLIIGGGINGATLALLLGQNNIKVTLCEPNAILSKKNPVFDGRAYALALSTQKMLKSIDIWDKLKHNSEPILDIRIGENNHKDSLSKTFLHFCHYEMAENADPMGYILEDRHLRSELIHKIKKCKNISIKDKCSIIEHQINPECVVSKLSNEEVIKSTLIIGSDGQNSQTAKFANINHFGWDYKQMSLVCAIKHEKPHNGCAYQFFRPSGPIAILPLPADHSSIVWTEKPDLAQEINKMKPNEYISALKSRIGADLGNISLSGERFLFPLKLSLAENFISNRIALVGDSAHGIHPLAGQGLNLGMRDIASLIEVIVTAVRRGEDIGSSSVLKRYENWRKFETSSMAASTDIINRMFSHNNQILKLATTIGLKAINSNPFLKKYIMREAAGLNGDLPKLLQGKSL
jgi:2-octaprenyl-6-methoxyphenol hydroxylase